MSQDQLPHARTEDGALPRIGILASRPDHAMMAAVLAAEGRTTMLDERGAVAAIRGRTIDLLIVAPRGHWWTDLVKLSHLDAEIRQANDNLMVLAMVPHGDAVALAAAFDSGVADCASYPPDVAEVVVRARALLRRKAVGDRRRADADVVRHLAMTDPVTGLWNRHHLDRELAAMVGRARAGARSLAVLMIDIDGFKPINDRYGHAIGDKVLRSVATRLAGGIRHGDTLARYGGDELALIMPDTGVAEATGVAERLRGLVADGIEVPFVVTISVGAAELGLGESATMLLTRADRALYAAKFDGRNRVAAAS